VKSAKLKIENPKVLSADKWNEIRDAHAKDTDWFRNWKQELIDQGYDGLKIEGKTEKLGRYDIEQPVQLAAFDNAQVVTHKQIVQDAIKEGKTVPPEVLADYPDLKPNISQPPKSETQAPLRITGEKQLPPVEDNFRRDLSDYAPKLYREVGPAKATELFEGNAQDSTPYFSNTPNLAKGQGENKGITVELDSKGLQGQINTSKPGWEIAYKNGEAEFIGKNNKDYRDNIQSVTIAKDTLSKSERLYRHLDQNPQFEKLNNTDGSVTFKRIGKQAIPLKETPVETTSAKPIIPKGVIGEPPKTVPAEQPKGKPSKVGLSIEAKAIEKSLTEGFGDTAEYTPLTIKDQAERAAKVLEDPERVARIIAGDEALPDGLRGGSFIKAVEDAAQTKGDVETLRNLAQSKLTSDTSLHAQELATLAQRTPDSAVMKMREVQKAREAEVQKRLGKRTIKEAVKAETEKIQKAVKENTPKKGDWAEFLRSIECR
jgi:hypothetical protein